MDKIRIAVAGIGNCASSLVQGINYYRDRPPLDTDSLMHWEIGGYKPGDIEVVSAFDIDRRKIGKDISRAIFEKPNCTEIFCNNIPETGVIVQMGPVRDGFSEHMMEFEERFRCLPSDDPEPDMDHVVKVLQDSGAHMLLNYLPVGSEEATQFYAECALEAGIAFINNIPVFIASNPEWAARFKEKNLPVAGDDIMSQLGATITHRALTEMFSRRGVRIERTYQLNTGGNTDFMNMLNRNRLKSKKESKTEAVQAVAGHRIDSDNIHVGPSDYVPWQKDNKVCFIRIEGKLFGNVPMNLELRLSVEDSPNSAGVAIDLIRCVKLALDRGVGGPLEGPSAYFCKHPPVQHTNEEARQMTEDFIRQG